jgi:hypothetical protein
MTNPNQTKSLWLLTVEDGKEQLKDLNLKFKEIESFTNGKPRIATEEDCKARWGTNRNRHGFRCRLCGHKFQVGDVWRFVLANFTGSPLKYGNFLTCIACDGPDVVSRAAAQEIEAETRFWWFRNEK